MSHIATRSPRPSATLAVTRRLSSIVSASPVLLAFVALVVLFSILSPYFVTVTNILNIGRQTTTVSIVAVGMTFVIISGEIDLSVGSILALSGMIAALALQDVDSFWAVGMLAGLGTGALVGLVNGALTTFLPIPSFLVTLGMLGIASGVANIVTGTAPVIIASPSYIRIFGQARVLGIPAPILWTVVMILLGIVALHLLSFGRKVYATGGNAKAARYSGINTRWVKIACFVIVGALSGLAALVLTAVTQAARPDFAQTLNIDVLAAVILGGASLAGGSGTIVGTVLGSLTIGVLNNGLTLIGVNSQTQLVVKGLIIIAAVGLRGGLRRRPG